jgi:hypothetical protein
MTGLLIVIAAVALLIAALAPAHHRATAPWRPGADLAVDRDRQRVGGSSPPSPSARYVVHDGWPVSWRRPGRPCRSTVRRPGSRRTEQAQVELRVPANASKASYVVSPTTIVVTSGVVRTSDLVRSSGLT